jgi:hypothetical protein
VGRAGIEPATLDGHSRMEDILSRIADTFEESHHSAVDGAHSSSRDARLPTQTLNRSSHK